MKQANLIIGSKEVLGTLNRTTAARIKADGANCSHLMHEIGTTDEENYSDQLKVAKSDAAIIPMPSDLQAPHFKEMCLVSQQSIKVVADLRKTETELFDYLASLNCLHFIGIIFWHPIRVTSKRLNKSYLCMMMVSLLKKMLPI